MNIENLVRQITDEVIQALNNDCPAHESCSDCGGDMHCASNKPGEVEELLRLGASRVGAGAGITNISKNLAPFIDHTLLKAEALPKDVKKLCDEAKKHVFASVCIQPSYVGLAAELLNGTPVKVCTVVGFPLGATSTQTKAYEAKVAEQEGATEIDMVIHVGALKSGGFAYVEDDIRAVVQAVSSSTIVKVIIETALLTDEEKTKACELAKRAGAHFVKTSTGFGPGGATAADIALMRRVVGETMGVKASGGIKDRSSAELMIKMGATRIGASASVKIVSDS